VSSAATELVTYESGDDGVGRITLRRDNVLNAVNGAMMGDLRRALDAYDEDPTTRVALLSGSGRAFCAGADLRDDPPAGSVEPAEDRSRLAEIFLIREQYKPIVAVVHGHAVGMGLHMALLSDFAVCADSTKFRAPEIRYGLNGGNYWWHLQSRAGDAFAMDVVATGRVWFGREAGERGLVTRSVSEETLGKEADQLGHVIAEQPPAAMAALVETRRSALRRIELESWHTRARGLGRRHPAAPH